LYIFKSKATLTAMGRGPRLQTQEFG